MTYKENEHYREIELFNDDGVKVGEAEVDTSGQMLARLTIFEPYRNKGYGERAVTELTYMYDLRELWVNADNFIAIHTYEKCGYQKTEPTMYKMVRTGKVEQNA